VNDRTLKVKFKKRPLQVLALALIAAGAHAQQPIEESPGAAKSLGYATVAGALTSLKTKSGVSVSVTKPDRWTIITEPAPVNAVWSFAPDGHYAYPAVVRRAVVRDSTGHVSMEMTALCEAAKEPCDRLMREFQQLNDRVRQRVQSQMAPGNVK
jgi:hypothetical protein